MGDRECEDNKKCLEEAISIECIEVRNYTILQYCLAAGLGLFVIFVIWFLSTCNELYWLRVILTIGLVILIGILLYMMYSTIHIFRSRGYV